MARKRANADEKAHSFRGGDATKHGTDLAPRLHMNNIKKRAEGLAKEVGGKIEGTVGKLVGSERIEKEGRAVELEGAKKQENAKTAERIKGKAEEVVGVLKKKVGELTGSEALEAKGRAKELQGEARQAANTAKH